MKIYLSLLVHVSETSIIIGPHFINTIQVRIKEKVNIFFGRKPAATFL